MGGIRLNTPFELKNKEYNMVVTGTAASGSTLKNQYTLGTNFITYYWSINIIAVGAAEISLAPEDTATSILSASIDVLNYPAADIIISFVGGKYRVTVLAFTSSKKCYITLTTKR